MANRTAARIAIPEPEIIRARRDARVAHAIAMSTKIIRVLVVLGIATRGPRRGSKLAMTAWRHGRITALPAQSTATFVRAATFAVSAALSAVGAVSDTMISIGVCS